MEDGAPIEPYIGRDQIAAMYRIKNEGRWIQRSLRRTFAVASKVVIFDDGSTDNTEAECGFALNAALTDKSPWGWIARGVSDYDKAEIHYIQSPFATTIRPKERVNEVRDKNILWSYCKSVIECHHFLCIDGDEYLSRAAIRNFKVGVDMLEATYDYLDVPVVYLWDKENRIRVDGVYGRAGDGLPQLRFPRLFTIKRMTELELFKHHFEMNTQWGAGFHCGSVPLAGFSPQGKPGIRGLFKHPIVHLGYIDKALRDWKFDFYTTLDPNNQQEGGYVHIIEKPNYYCPGPTRFGQWEDV